MGFTGKTILHIISGLDNGGAEAVLYRLSCFDRQNVQIVVSLTDTGKYGELLTNAGITVHCLDMPKSSLSFNSLYKLWRLIYEIKPDVVQTWMYHADLIGGLITRMAGIRSVCWGIHHTDVHPVKTKRMTRWVVWLCSQLSRWLPARIVCCAHKSLQVHEELGYPANKCVVVTNGYDLSRFRPNLTERLDLRSNFGIADSMPVFGMVARFDSQKDHANLIKALSILKKEKIDFRFVLVGSGSTTDNLELSSLIIEYDLDDRALLLGERNDIPALMNVFDINILSSAYGEAFPNVLAEAMACGTPCVATDVGDASVIVADTGWIVPIQNEQVLADALAECIQMMSDQSEWVDRQLRCRNRIVDNFSIEKTVHGYQQVWQECLTK